MSLATCDSEKPGAGRDLVERGLDDELRAMLELLVQRSLRTSPSQVPLKYLIIDAAEQPAAQLGGS